MMMSWFFGIVGFWYCGVMVFYGNKKDEVKKMLYLHWPYIP